MDSRIVINITFDILFFTLKLGLFGLCFFYIRFILMCVCL